MVIYRIMVREMLRCQLGLNCRSAGLAAVCDTPDASMVALLWAQGEGEAVPQGHHYAAPEVMLHDAWHAGSTPALLSPLVQPHALRSLPAVLLRHLRIVPFLLSGSA